jgi:leucyl aminopeptidase
MVKFSTATGDIFALKTAAALVYMYEGEALKSVDALTDGKIAAALKSKRFTGKKKETLIIDAPKKANVQHIIVVGLGEKKKNLLDDVRLAVAAGVKAAKSLKAESVSTLIPVISEHSVQETAYAVLEGIFLAAYKFPGIHKPDPEKDDKEIRLCVLVDDEAVSFKKIIAKAVIVQAAVNRAKQLVNLPSNMVRPATLEKYAKEIAAQHKNVKCKVFSFAEAKAKGFGGFCAVAQGSEEPARFIVLEYWGGTGKDAVALVGKGITFDSGGISIKPAAGMGEMKTDMSGAATTLSAFQALVALGVKKNILCLVPTTENMPSGKSYKPGDVITTYNGRTVEINSTDAEGRMILCDALTYAQELGATKIIDYATLTGACTIALGQTRAGVMTNSQAFCDEYIDVSEKVGEKHWQLPMDEEYEELLKSHVADTLNNAEKKYAGTIAAAKFLERFINKGNEWIHCDIAGTAFLDKPQRYLDKMATGFGIRTLVEWLS